MLAALSLALVVAACGTQKRNPPSGRSPAANHQPAPTPANQSNPGATIQIDYSRKSDFLSSLTVTKFTGARLISVQPGVEKNGASIVRFEGGVPVWQIGADESITREVLAEIPLIHAGSKYALKQVTYGALPKNFLQTMPDSGPPEPIEVGSYYVFEVDRASGAVSFEAIKVQADGSIEAYDAQPRAGDSYALCCNLSPDFAAANSP